MTNNYHGTSICSHLPQAPLADSHSFMNENDESQWRKRSLRISLPSAHTSSFHLAAKNAHASQGCEISCQSVGEKKPQICGEIPRLLATLLKMTTGRHTRRYLHDIFRPTDDAPVKSGSEVGGRGCRSVGRSVGQICQPDFPLPPPISPFINRS